jgi:hypothetical protein
MRGEREDGWRRGASTGDCGIPADNGRGERKPPPVFSPLSVYGLPHINSIQFLTVMQATDVVLNSFSYFLSIPQAPSSQEALFCSSIHSRPKLGITYFYEVSVTGIEELATAIAAMHNIIRRGGNTNLTVPSRATNSLVARLGLSRCL